MTTMKALVLAVGLLTSALAAPFDYDRYDREDVEKFKVSTYYKHLKASYQHEGTKSGDAMLNRKSVTIVWEWKDGVCTSVSEYVMNDRGEYDFASKTKCSFEQGDVMDVAELFFNEDGVESFKQKYGKEAKEDVAEGQVYSKQDKKELKVRERDNAFKAAAKADGVTIDQLMRRIAIHRRVGYNAGFNFHSGAWSGGQFKYIAKSYKELINAGNEQRILIKIAHTSRTGQKRTLTIVSDVITSALDPNVFNVRNQNIFEDVDGKLIKIHNIK